MEKGSNLPKQGHCSVEFSGDRLRFTVNLNPDETTIVSWKNLIKEANLNKCNPNSSSSLSVGDQHGFDSHPPPPPPPPPSVEPSSGNLTTKNKPKDLQAQASSDRLNAVIERIERMYAVSWESW